MEHPNLKILGTSHIAAQSIQEIKSTVAAFQPDIIAVELDTQRAAALFQKGKTSLNPMHIFRFGLKGYLFAVIGQYVQQRLGKIVGVMPGSDMKTAIELAREKKLTIALVDQPIQITLQRFSRGITWKERFRFVADFFLGIFSPKKQMRCLLEHFLPKTDEKDWLYQLRPNKSTKERSYHQNDRSSQEKIPVHSQSPNY